eukprot:Nitzschia sp. Nitz4//scaffold1_size375055//227972//229468//NITZ4_000293-RA/size375055-processed-gene-0.373-mRNA-1//1//CDS//3329541096//4063//frame0
MEGTSGNARRKNNRNRHNNKSRSPTRQGPSRSTSASSHNKSKSPPPNRNPRRRKGKHDSPAEMTVICYRSDLWDSAAHFMPDDSQQLLHIVPESLVRPYRFDLHRGNHRSSTSFHSVSVTRVPHHFEPGELPKKVGDNGEVICDVVDTTIVNPHDPTVVHDKYWAQRRRLFSKFDQGIRLDTEGWYSVTPEIIADHVAKRVGELVTNGTIPQHAPEEGIVIFDAFCGCGGNAIAFGKMPRNLISKVVCVDLDRSKLLNAAHNASLYGIPKDKIVFIECNSSFLLTHAYRDGEFVLNKPTHKLPPFFPLPVQRTTASGYALGGLDLLPHRIDAVFMDPPWGGIDYEILGKNGYDLQKNMKIAMSPHLHPPAQDDYEADGDGCDDFFDSFAADPTPKSRIENFNKHSEEEHCIDGMELLRVAAAATHSHVVLYDLPRNTNKYSLGRCALGAGYRGNLKLEEHYLNGRLKTVTAYMGVDYCELINPLVPDRATDTASGDEL